MSSLLLTSNNQPHATTRSAFVTSKSDINEYNTMPSSDICEVNLDDLINQFNKNGAISYDVKQAIKRAINSAKVIVVTGDNFTSQNENAKLISDIFEVYIARVLDRRRFGGDIKIYFINENPNELYHRLVQIVNEECYDSPSRKVQYLEILRDLFEV